MCNMKTAKQFERYFKGVANHHRIAILHLVSKNEGITLDGIAGHLGRNFKTISEHTRKLVHSGLLNKNYKGQNVVHSLSPYGIKFLKFMQLF